MNAVTKDFATEGGHWYCPKTGEPRYTILGKNGKERGTTVKDARANGYVPSVTTILRQAAAPGLERWKIANAITSALTLTRQEGESDEAFLYRVVKDSEEQAKKARERGTEIHGAIERLDRTGPYARHVSAAMDAVTAWAGLQDWASERSFASPLGFGGKLDLSAPGFVLDFKTTDKTLEGIKTWPEHRRQLAAYREGLNDPKARCAIVYVSVDGEAKLIEIDDDELQQGWEEFKALLAFYRALNRLN
jgi:hypothetical protein